MIKHVRTLQIRHVDAGSCNGCEQELIALTNRYYDMQKHGIDIVASPRHADALLVTGPITDTMARAVEKVWDAIPRPSIRIAFGDCSSGCGPFGEAYASRAGLDNPDIEILGCPPNPAQALWVIKKWMDAHRINGRRYEKIESGRGQREPT